MLAGGGVSALVLLATAPAWSLPKDRGWELVSPLEKGGGQIDPPGAIAGGGTLQAAAQGSLVTYGSRASFAGGAGAPPASQYVSSRTGGGWATQNITVPIFSSSYDFADRGAPYELFSTDLARSLLRNGDRCRGETSECPVVNPPLAGTDAPAGYRNYYLREGSSFEALIGSSDVAGRGIDPAEFEVRLGGAAPDLRTVILTSCAELTDDAADGCGEGKPNLYRWTQSSGSLGLVNGAPGAELAAPAGAVSTDGSRVYWTDLNTGNLQLRLGATNTQVDASTGGGGTFEAASTDGTVAYFSKSGHLWRYTGGVATDLTPSGGVAGVLGASSDGSRVYFQDGVGLKLWSSGTTTTVAPGANAADSGAWPPATGASRVSADGTKLLFASEEKLTGYDNTDKFTGQPDSQVFLYDATAASLRCVSCNPKGKQPIGPSTIPGAIANGTAPGSVQAYKPRVLSANGKRVFFDSADSLVTGDSNSIPATGVGVPDVYQWQAQGEGGCAQLAGCLDVISNGALPSGASFVDASADGSDAYFLTEASLLGADFGSMDLYDARIGGGFPEPQPPIPCDGDACQILPAVPSSPDLATLQPGVGNPPVSYRKYCRKGYVKRKGICVKKGSRKRKRARRQQGARRVRGDARPHRMDAHHPRAKR